MRITALTYTPIITEAEWQIITEYSNSVIHFEAVNCQKLSIERTLNPNI